MYGPAPSLMTPWQSSIVVTSPQMSTSRTTADTSDKRHGWSVASTSVPFLVAASGRIVTADGCLVAAITSDDRSTEPTPNAEMSPALTQHSDDGFVCKTAASMLDKLRSNTLKSAAAKCDNLTTGSAFSEPPIEFSLRSMRGRLASSVPTPTAAPFT